MRTNKGALILILKALVVVTLVTTATNLYQKHTEEIQKQAYWQGVEAQFNEERYLEQKENKNAKEGVNLPSGDCFKISSNVEVNKLLQKHFKDCKNAKIMWAIAQAESKGKTDAENKANRNGSWDCGYFQNNTIHRKKGQSFEDFCKEQKDLYTNFITAEKILQKQGLTAWSTFNNKKYLTYLK